METEMPPITKNDAPNREDHYKIVIEDARSLGDRRDRMNDLFIGLITLALGAQAYLLINFGLLDWASTAYIAVIALLGAYVCSLWRKVLNGYKRLLGYRYDVLKMWETDWFPNDQRFYLSEDVLYDPKVASSAPTSIIRRLPPSSKIVKPFVDIYTVLPARARIALLLVALVRPLLLLVHYAPNLADYISHLR